MELNITKFVKEYLLTGNASDFSCSQMERGSYAGIGSFNHAVETTEHFNLVTAETRPAIEAHYKSFGCWDEDEISSWTDEELNGLCLQEIAGEYKEWEFDPENCSGNFYDASQTVDGNYYFYFGN